MSVVIGPRAGVAAGSGGTECADGPWTARPAALRREEQAHRYDGHAVATELAALHVDAPPPLSLDSDDM